MDKNKLKLIIGLLLITVSFVCVAAMLYFMGDSNRVNKQRLVVLQVELANLMAEKSSGYLKKTDTERTKREPIKLEDMLSRAESIYGKEELARKEGILWIDRKTSTYMITLGAVNGLKTQSQLTIYDGDKKIGQATVKTTFDIISYVKPVGKSLSEFDKSYYRVVIE